MSYAVVQDMIDRFGAAELTQLTDRADPPAGTYDSDAIEQALNDAEAEIDAYLLARYALPLTTVPTMLTRLTCDLARYQLHGPALTEEVTKRYSDAIAFLKSVSRGAMPFSASIKALGTHQQWLMRLSISAQEELSAVTL